VSLPGAVAAGHQLRGERATGMIYGEPGVLVTDLMSGHDGPHWDWWPGSACPRCGNGRDGYHQCLPLVSRDRGPTKRTEGP